MSKSHTFHPPCPVVPDGDPRQLADGRMEHPYRGTDGRRYVYVTDGACGEWSAPSEQAEDRG